MNAFLSLMKKVYLEPRSAYQEVGDLEEPRVGFYGYLGRGILTSAIYYLPLTVFNRTPAIPSYITILPTDMYYLAMTILFPFINLGIWLLCGGIYHLLLGYISKRNDIDAILNISGITWFALGPIILTFDIIVVWIVNGIDPVIWGILHLLMDAYYLFLMCLAYKEILAVDCKVTIMLFFIGMLVSVPIAMILIRP